MASNGLFVLSYLNYSKVEWYGIHRQMVLTLGDNIAFNFFCYVTFYEIVFSNLYPAKWQYI